MLQYRQEVDILHSQFVFQTQWEVVSPSKEYQIMQRKLSSGRKKINCYFQEPVILHSIKIFFLKYDSLRNISDYFVTNQIEVVP